MSRPATDDLSTFPSAASGDPDDVRWALETGKAMWQKGDKREALRWLRRAAETASEEGADERALALAKAAADRRTELDIPQSIAPPAQAAAASQPPAAEVEPAVGAEPAEEPTQEWQAEELLAAHGRRVAAGPKESSAPELATHHAIRVALTEPDDRGIFRGRQLKRGEDPPEGTTLALVVAVEPDRDLFS